MDTSAVKLPTWPFFRRLSGLNLCPLPKVAFQTSVKELSRPAATRVRFQMGANPSGMLGSKRQGPLSTDLFLANLAWLQTR